jgi:hypothetical protein
LKKLRRDLIMTKVTLQQSGEGEKEFSAGATRVKLHGGPTTKKEVQAAPTPETAPKSQTKAKKGKRK